MAVVAGIVFAEKILPIGERLTRLVAVVLVAIGIWIPVALEGFPD